MEPGERKISYSLQIAMLLLCGKDIYFIPKTFYGNGNGKCINHYYCFVFVAGATAEAVDQRVCVGKTPRKVNKINK